jgi:hypothetical protein
VQGAPSIFSSLFPDFHEDSSSSTSIPYPIGHNILKTSLDWGGGIIDELDIGSTLVKVSNIWHIDS